MSWFYIHDLTHNHYLSYNLSIKMISTDTIFMLKFTRVILTIPFDIKFTNFCLFFFFLWLQSVKIVVNVYFGVQQFDAELGHIQPIQDEVLDHLL